jgi:hypothetical protein
MLLAQDSRRSRMRFSRTDHEPQADLHQSPSDP